MPPLDETDLRRQLLDAARDLILSEGYYHLSMRKVARRVGVSATSIYLYFQNKDAIFHTLMDEGFEALYAALAEVAEVIDDPAKRMKALCQAYVAFGLVQPERYEVMFLLHPEHMAHYPVANLRRSVRALDLMRETLSEGQAQGIWKIRDARTEANVIWAALHGAVSLLNAGRVDMRVDAESLVEATVRRLLAAFVDSDPSTQRAVL